MKEDLTDEIQAELERRPQGTKIVTIIRRDAPRDRKSVGVFIYFVPDLETEKIKKTLETAGLEVDGSSTFLTFSDADGTWHCLALDTIRQARVTAP